jgi:hypothetical protein
VSISRKWWRSKLKMLLRLRDVCRRRGGGNAAGVVNFDVVGVASRVVQSHTVIVT